MLNQYNLVKTTSTRSLLATALVSVVALTSASSRAADPLPSWNNTAAKQAIITFVQKVTREGSPDFVPAPERIATFDNDGTLWCEQPMYFQLLFALDRVKALAPQHAEWKTREPFASLLKGDVKAALAGGDKAILEIVMATHAGMTTEEFEKTVKDWIATAKHPTTGKPLLEMVYQPMLELLAYLRANGFKTFIVSGGGVEFMRPWTEKVYGIPPEQVVGSSVKTKYQMREGQPVLIRLPEINFIDDKAGKPVGINSHIGRRPIAAFGNSDGDRQMLEWTQAGGGARLMMLVHHDDAKREFEYGAKSPIGTFSDSLMDEAKKSGWTVISMKDDWRSVYNSTTGTRVVGQRGAVQNVYTGNYAYGGRAAGYNEKTGVAGAGSKVTVGNERTGNQGTAGRATIYNPNTGNATHISGARGEQGGALNVNGHVIAGKDGNYYRPDGSGGWEQMTRPSGGGEPRENANPQTEQSARQRQWQTASPELQQRQALNNEFQARQWGERRQQSFEMNRPSFRGGGFRRR